jgi:hypothetical protein
MLFALFIGSPFKIPVGEPPDPRKVHIYGPGIEDGLLHSYQSRFLVDRKTCLKCPNLITGTSILYSEMC